uniref:Uncharacterized protein n=1 Tax=Strombidium inclinatum TaxID=197538 RepID=A0A7S3IPZ2_9SPIT|mmetsp:Transcript_28894/g.43633  ORF Transcript_28894/g.43633 Transcript_28894/m.43633 type:complete len:179 (+) Transcript_28894:40-576(+)
MKALSTLAMLLGVEVGFNLADTEEFIAGLIYGLVNDDDLSEIQQCLQGGQQLEDEIETAVADFKKKDITDIIAGIEVIGQIVQEFPTDLENCKNMQGDIDRIEAWAQIFKDPKQLVKTMTVNFMKNKTPIIGNATAVASDWAAENYYQSGDDIANVLVLAIGAVPNATQPEDLDLTQW